ncbi:hypothetical protein ACFQZZ_01100 [Nocardia sp. GCM10030253]|uniref:hypothetical protein n=1 Tax=Nocardia sp. GCM10030253 TaxID=3273404 RepID=UPI0036457378
MNNLNRSTEFDRVDDTVNLIQALDIGFGVEPVTCSIPVVHPLPSHFHRRTSRWYRRR